MKLVVDRVSERQRKRQGMSLSLTVWFADATTEAERLDIVQKWLDGLQQTMSTARPSWVHFKGEGVPECLEGVFGSGTKPTLTLVTGKDAEDV